MVKMTVFWDGHVMYHAFIDVSKLLAASIIRGNSISRGFRLKLAVTNWYWPMTRKDSGETAKFYQTCTIARRKLVRVVLNNVHFNANSQRTRSCTHHFVSAGDA